MITIEREKEMAEWDAPQENVIGVGEHKELLLLAADLNWSTDLSAGV